MDDLASNTVVLIVEVTFEPEIVLLTVAFFEEAVIDVIGASVDGFSVEVAFEPEVVLLTVAFFEEAMIDIAGASVDEFSVEVAFDVAVDNPSLVTFGVSVEVPNNKSIFYY